MTYMIKDDGKMDKLPLMIYNRTLF